MLKDLIDDFTSGSDSTLRVDLKGLSTQLIDRVSFMGNISSEVKNHDFEIFVEDIKAAGLKL